MIKQTKNNNSLKTHLESPLLDSIPIEKTSQGIIEENSSCKIKNKMSSTIYLINTISKKKRKSFLKILDFSIYQFN